MWPKTERRQDGIVDMKKDRACMCNLHLQQQDTVVLEEFTKNVKNNRQKIVRGPQ